MALTDHNTVAGWKAVSEEAKKQGFPLILGEEIRVYEEKRCVGEILGLFLNELVSTASPETVLEKIREQDGLAVIAHPFENASRHGFVPLKEFSRKAVAIEVLNSRCFSEKTNEKAKEFAEQNDLPQTAGSDSHTPWEIGNAFVETNAADLEELRKNIRNGKIRVNGKRSNPCVHVFSSLAKLNLFPKL
jgi:predicted metal-dependent phosphoesterase TrpH